MTNEEAIDTLRLMMRVRVSEEVNAVGLAIKALEKQIPKKVRNEEFISGNAFGECPNCESYIGEWEYCPTCGQAIDWSVVK